MQKYVEIIEQAISRSPWNNSQSYWFSPQERDLVEYLWHMLKDFTLGKETNSTRHIFWIYDQNGNSINFSARPSYDLLTSKIVGITFFFDPDKTSIEDVLGAILHQTRETTQV